MADPVSAAKKELRHAISARQEKAAAFWQQDVIEGRVIRQARVEMQAGEKATVTQQQIPTTSRVRTSRQQR